jgi:hypothetical protein
VLRLIYISIQNTKLFLIRYVINPPYDNSRVGPVTAFFWDQ